MNDEFGINLKIWYNIPLENQDPSVSKLGPILEELDPFVLCALSQTARLSKSTALALMLLWRQDVKIE